MNSGKPRLKTLGRSFVVLCGLISVTAPAAQAQWLVGGAELKTNETVAVNAFPKVSNSLTVEKLNIEIQCTTLSSTNLELFASSTKGEGDLDFSGCTTFSPIKSGKEQAPCKPKEPIKAGGRWHLILHNGIGYILVEPRTGLKGVLATVGFQESCALAESSELTGELVFECGHLNPPLTWLGLDCLIKEVSHLIRLASEELFTEAPLKFGSNPAKMTVVAELSLSGENKGKEWCGHI